MTTPLLKDAFAHHVWATLRIIDTCASLSPDQLEANAAGTYGPILATLRHLVGADTSYLNVLSGVRVPPIDEDGMDLAALRTAMASHDAAWSTLLAQDLDADHAVVRQRDDGSTSTAPLSIRVAQALHHGTDHRSQICTALSTLGVAPPDIDVWDFAQQAGRLSETPPTG